MPLAISLTHSIHRSTLRVFQIHQPGQSGQPYLLGDLASFHSLSGKVKPDELYSVIPKCNQSFYCGTFSLLHPRKGAWYRACPSMTHHHQSSPLFSQISLFSWVGEGVQGILAQRRESSVDWGSFFVITSPTFLIHTAVLSVLLRPRH